MSQTLMEPQTRALVAHAHLVTSAQLAQVSHSSALWALTQTGKLLGSADANFYIPFLCCFSLNPLTNRVQLSKVHWTHICTDNKSSLLFSLGQRCRHKWSTC